MASVELRRVSKVFPGGVAALRDVNLEVRDGEILVLLGPNGSGKTTILRLIAGLDRPSSGEICIGGQVVDDWPPKRRNVAMVFQGCVLYPHLTVERNIAFGLDRRYGSWLDRIWNQLANRMGVSEPAKSREIRDRVRHTAQLLGVEHLLDRFPRQLSGGERQRVALGRVFVRQQAVFLLDEPWSNLDVRLRQSMRLELRRLRQQTGAATILVTHDHTEALALGDRIAVLENGRVHQIGTPAEILHDPRTRFVAEFIGSPPMNFVPGWLKSSESGVRLESDTWQVQWNGFELARGTTCERDLAVWLAFPVDGAAVRTDATSDWLPLHGVVAGTEIVAGETQILVRPRAEVSREGLDIPLVVKAEKGRGFHTDQEVWLVVDPHRLQIFGQQTEERIYLGLEAKSK